ncbi:hypothetical protein NLG97_g876 [Lecanicillium saksenae]|uniref:Uncharacterized protein n=1 Tax=Lecanicillium saksenae TaxID=468837 RepID=A0ACC1R8S8_9HYPO|nr:hypothetical protein NLG97_g876 [Lecanicillium saksenae]
MVVITTAPSPIYYRAKLATAQALAHRTASHIASLRDEVKKAGSSCEIHEHVLDVTDEEQTIPVFKKTIAAYGRLDFYFANAGVGQYKPVVLTPTRLTLRLTCIS